MQFTFENSEALEVLEALQRAGFSPCPYCDVLTLYPNEEGMCNMCADNPLNADELEGVDPSDICELCGGVHLRDGCVEIG